MVSVGRHPNIKLLSYSEVEAVTGYVGNYTVRVHRKPRYIDVSTCSGCGQCAEVCPVEIDNPFDIGLSKRKAVYRNSAQAVPGAFAIEKHGTAPCRTACPTDQRAQGYVALIRQRRYTDAYRTIKTDNPFPSVCGRVCNHYCEEACSRGGYDAPVNIMGLKRFVSDWAYQHRKEIAPALGDLHKTHPAPSGKKVAIIGAGPAGLTAGLDLVRMGHKAVVFDSLPVAGGMMRVGIPPHRLPEELLDWEIQQILDEGVELRLNTWVDDVPALFEQGYHAVLIATGAHSARKLAIRNSNHPDNWLSLDVLRQARLSVAKGIPAPKKPSLDPTGKKVVVLGGGNVALDTARTVLRMGAEEVRMACLESRGEMPGFQWEVAVAEEEGIRMYPGRTFKEIVVENDHIAGVRCVEIDFQGFRRGRPIFSEIPGSEHILPADIVVWAIGQSPNFSFLPEDGSINTRYPVGVEADEKMMTTMNGVFVAGDVRRGVTFYVVDAIAEGHIAARSIDSFMRGEPDAQRPKMPDVVNLSRDEIAEKIEIGESSARERIAIQSIPLEQRIHNFREVDLTLTEQEALTEAERCLRCGVCSECLECVRACDRGAIDHYMADEIAEFTVGTVLLATGFKDFDAHQAPELGYGRLDNVITAMEFERLINVSGPTGGNVLLKNGKPPSSVAIVHCVGSRDAKHNEYCSRACCMYSLKLAQLVHEYVHAEVYEIYRDMRTFGKDYEEFFNRTKAKGVNFYHGRVKKIDRRNGHLVVHWDEAFFNQPSQVSVDMVILATGFEPQKDAAHVSSVFGVSRSKDGFFLEKHPKLAPVETASQGIFLAGACQSPKDIPDSVAQAGGAAAGALSLLDQGTITLDPSVAQVLTQRCAGCGQCVQSCPYAAIELSQGTAVVNSFLCKGCGTCAAACPNKAMTLIHFDDQQVVNEIIGALAQERPFVPGILKPQEVPSEL